MICGILDDCMKSELSVEFNGGSQWIFGAVYEILYTCLLIAYKYFSSPNSYKSSDAADFLRSFLAVLTYMEAVSNQQ